MGWKIFTTFIKDTGEITINEELVKSLGFRDFIFVEETNFCESPEEGELYISNYKGNLLIANADLLWQFTKTQVSKTEELFTGRFPNHQIISVNLGYGTYFSVIDCAKKIRVREVGDAIYQDIGLPLPEEIYLLSQQLIDNDELIEMENELTEDEIKNQIQSVLAYETVFELTKRIFGKRYDELELSEYNIKSYKFQNFVIDSVNDYGVKAEMQFIK